MVHNLTWQEWFRKSR